VAGSRSRPPEGRWRYVEQRRVLWTAPYGGAVGTLIALLVLIAAVVLWLTNQMDPKLCAFFGALALARLL
jgi:hypothetical protein